jgi:hypothetical protein
MDRESQVRNVIPKGLYLHDKDPEPKDTLEVDTDAPVVRQRTQRTRITHCEFNSTKMSIREYFNVASCGSFLCQHWIVDSFEII